MNTTLWHVSMTPGLTDMTPSGLILFSLYMNFIKNVATEGIQLGVSVKRGPDGCGWRMQMADGKVRMEKCG